MELITIRVKDKQKAQALVKFLETLDFVETIKGATQSTVDTNQSASVFDFFDLAGLWAGRDFTLDTLRRKAWPERA